VLLYERHFDIPVCFFQRNEVLLSLYVDCVEDPFRVYSDLVFHEAEGCGFVRVAEESDFEGDTTLKHKCKTTRRGEKEAQDMGQKED
jgi:hypothetical protein